MNNPGNRKILAGIGLLQEVQAYPARLHAIMLVMPAMLKGFTGTHLCG